MDEETNKYLRLLYPRVTAIQIYVTALTSKMISKGMLSWEDVQSMHVMTKSVADYMQKHSNTKMQIGGLDIQNELNALFSILETDEDESS